MFKTLGSIFKNRDLRRKVIFTLLMLIIFRLGSFIPVPGVDRNVLDSLKAQGNLFGVLDTFSGGALAQFSILAIGIMPYITASIVIQLLQMDVVPKLTEWSKQGEAGRKKIKITTRYLTIVIAILQGTGVSLGFNAMLPGLIPNPSFGTIALITTCLTLGTIALMIMGELITKKGIGNGISMIIFAGIVVTLPSTMEMIYATELYNAKDQLFMHIVKVVLIVLFALFVIVGVVYFNQAVRKIPVHYSQQTASGRQAAFSKQTSFLPIKINSAGVIPVIFAVSLFTMPQLISNFANGNSVALKIAQVFDYTKPLGMVIYATLIVFFTFFYAFVQLNPEKLSKNLQLQGGYIPGIRPGKDTEDYISKVITRLTVVGSIFLAILALLPVLVNLIAQLPTQVQIGGISLLIIVSVALDTVEQIKTNTMKNNYKTFI